MTLYLIILALAICIRYSPKTMYAELFGLTLSALVIVSQWQEKGLLAIVLILLIAVIKSYRSACGNNKLVLFLFTLFAFIWYSEAKYSLLSSALEHVGMAELGLNTVVSVIGASYILMRLLIYILADYQAIGFISSVHYILFAPALPTGPIQTVEEYNSSRINRIAIINSGPILGRIIWGAIKVLVISSYLAPYALDFDNVTVFAEYVWLNIVLSLCVYTVYLYLNFSGSIDIVIGVSNLLGWMLPENFNWPLFATNIQDFWRRWHMSLTNTLRNIFFVPFVKLFNFSDGDIRRLLVSIIGFYLIFGLSALWHNFTYNFLLWGVWHATGMTLHIFYKKLVTKQSILQNYAYKALSFVVTFVFVSLGWLFFTYPSPAILNKAIYYHEFNIQEVRLAEPYGTTILLNYRPVNNGFVNVAVDKGDGSKDYVKWRDGKYNFVHIHGEADASGDRSLQNKDYRVKLDFYDPHKNYLYSYSQKIEIKNGK